MTLRPIGTEFEYRFGPMASSSVQNDTVFIYRVVAHDEVQNFPWSKPYLAERIKPVSFQEQRSRSDREQTGMTDWGKCIWCGCGSTKPTFVCSAPDGNGHLFDRIKRPDDKPSAATAIGNRRA